MKFENPVYFEVKTRYERMLENGQIKRVTDTCIAVAQSFSEAEAMTDEYVASLMFNEPETKSIRIVNYAEFYRKEELGVYFFNATLEFTTLDEKTGKEKKSRKKVLISADNREEAEALLKEKLNESIVDFRLVSFSETNICDVIYPKECESSNS